MAIFDVEQTVHIAQTIFRYEEKTTYGSGTGPLSAAGAFVKNEPSAQLPWSTNVMLGLMPTTLRAGPGSDGHLLEFATAFMHHPEVRDRFLERFRDDLDREVDDGSAYYGVSRIIPGPSDPELRFDKGRTRLFSPHHAAWYTPRVLVKLTTERLIYQNGVGHFLGQVGDALARSEQSRDILQEVATKAVLREVRKKAQGRVDYLALAEAVRLGDHELLETELVRLHGVMQIMCITLPVSSSKAMVAGLRAMASYKHHSLLRRMGRAPTVEELLEANVKGAANLWHRMPWAFLGPLVQEHGSALRAALLKRTELKMEELRECLVDHPLRYKLDQVERSEALSRDSWAEFAGHLQRYFPAQRAREILLEAYPLEVVKLIAYRHFTNREDLIKYVDHLLNEPARHALAAYASPFTESSGIYRSVI